MNTPETNSQPQWFAAIIARVPTNFSTPFKVAIQAHSLAHAQDRLYKLYSNDIYSGRGRNMSEEVYAVKDEDEIVNAQKYPLKSY